MPACLIDKELAGSSPISQIIFHGYHCMYDNLQWDTGPGILPREPCIWSKIFFFVLIFWEKMYFLSNAIAVQNSAGLFCSYGVKSLTTVAHIFNRNEKNYDNSIYAHALSTENKCLFKLPSFPNPWWRSQLVPLLAVTQEYCQLKCLLYSSTLGPDSDES